ncbi:TOBE domain-containing protein [Halorubraceae archaeon YAN]|nr:TOBE domain-containing protein [Halorubraceae archaeon YAN]
MTERGFEATLSIGDATVTAKDIELLRAIDRTGSLSAAAASLGRSYAHLQRRVVELESEIGSLTTRQRGGADGGGTALTDRAHQLCARFDRLHAELTGVTTVDESVFHGTVTVRSGQIGTVETDIGPIRALVPETERTRVRVGVRSDAVVLDTPDGAANENETSRRNSYDGKVSSVDTQDGIVRIGVSINGHELRALLTAESCTRLDLAVGDPVCASFKATAARAVTDRSTADNR